MGANQSQADVVGVVQPLGVNPFQKNRMEKDDLPPQSQWSNGSIGTRGFFGSKSATLLSPDPKQRPKRKVSDASTAITDFSFAEDYNSTAILPASPKRSRIVTPSLASMPRQISRSITAALFPKILMDDDDENNDELIHQVLYDGLGQGDRPVLEEPDLPRRALFPE